ncbi:MAG TPA: 50S ribosomal protein L19 [Patescibacteria group bacterium]
MDAIKHFTLSSLKRSVPELRPGDTVRVHQKIREGNKERVQIFEGVVMAVRGGKAINSSFVVRRIASGVGVERTFPLHSPNVVKVERVKSGKVRQARLYYLRERFGRAARLAGEVKSTDQWHEGQVEDEVVAEVEEPAMESPEESTEAEQSVETEEPTEVEAPAEEVAPTEEAADAESEAAENKE